MLTLPLYDFWRQEAQEWDDYFGWNVPRHFGDWQQEYQSALQAAVVWDISPRTTVVITGKDRAAFLHNFCTNDIVRTPIGRGCEAFLTTGQAKILAWFHAFAEDEAITLDADPGRGPIILRHLSRYVITEEVTCEERTGQLVILHVAGPSAGDVLARVFHTSQLPRQTHEHGAFSYQGQRLRVRCLARLGLPGWDIVAETASVRSLAEQLRICGAAPLGYAAAEVLRVEAGWPVFGRDLDETNLPQEVGRDDRAISFTKGCYLGQETVARIRAYGHVNRKLCGIRFATAEVLPAGTKLFPTSAPSAESGASTEIGRITSCVYSPRLGSAIALAWLRRGHWDTGTMVLAETVTGRVEAIVSALPFVA
ncbi:MAG: glycine cleavage T C-terminal barrel domain-containing protein [Gemmatales bacterium]|nr:hypothetical protein [Gemmatales bacterium]MDW7995587.1 glycine cleavage T C-terminal barrel domain-containing protein [Gemmatales bacterium]